MSLTKHVHRASALKQQNKKHNTLGHRTKGQVQSQNRGRVDIKTLHRTPKSELNRQQRKHQAKQIRSNKREEIRLKKRSLGTNSSPPFLVSIVPLSLNVNPKEVLRQLCECVGSSSLKTSERGILHFSCSRLKQRFSFVVPPVDDLFAILDAAKVSDTVMLVWSVGEELSAGADLLLSSLKSQGMPSLVHCAMGDQDLPNKKRMRIVKDLQHEINSRFPGTCNRPYFLSKIQDVNLILRQIGLQKQKNVFYRDQRSHLLAEKVEFEGEGTSGTLKLHGYVRGQPLSVNSLIHIPGWGEFQMSQIDYLADAFPLELNQRKGAAQSVGNAQEQIFVEYPNPELQQSLDSTVEVDPMDEDQPWPTEEEIQTAETERAIMKRAKLPRGTSEYQAAWMIYDDQDEDGANDDASEISSMADDSQTDFAPSPECSDDDNEAEYEEENSCADEYDDEDRTTLTDVEDHYDSTIDYKEEMNLFQKLKASREDMAFPDEMDTPLDIEARVRFQKYRGLQSFRSSPWNKDESLPFDYKRIVHFRNYSHARKRIFKADKVGAGTGQYVTLYLKDVPKFLFSEHIRSESPLVAFSLLPYEQKMSLLNLVVKVHSSASNSVLPVKAKEKLIFHLGFRRFSNSPIFSEHTTGDKFKFCRFLQSGQTVVASMFAPITFSPCPVAVFKESANGVHELIATGSVLSADPNRIICKRVVLSGHPLKINRKSAVIRYMFFNAEDILWFKSIELRTKWGKRGHIKDPVGTHGHMKCQFDGQLKSQDTVLMNLYKRIFPKWRYDPIVSRPPPLFTSQTTAVEADTNDSSLEEPRQKKKKIQFSTNNVYFD